MNASSDRRGGIEIPRGCFLEISFPLCPFRGEPSNRSLTDKRRVNTNDEPRRPVDSESPPRLEEYRYLRTPRDARLLRAGLFY